MKRCLKKGMALLLALLMAVSTMSVMAVAEEEDPGSDESSIMEDTEELNETETGLNADPDYQNITAPGGFVLDQNETDQSKVTTLANTDSGTYGDNVTWRLDSDGTLTISGSGDMDDASSASAIPWYIYRNSITAIVVSEGITSIGSYCFTYCGATGVSLPDTLVSINRSAFTYSNLTSVTIPSHVTTIESGAFAYCYDLAEINLGNSVQTIRDYAFQCVCAREVTIPASVSTISNLAFFDSQIENYYASGNSTYTAKDGVLYTNGGTTLFAYPQGNSASSFTVPSGVTEIGSQAFSFAKNLTSITFPSSVTAFSSSAFQGMYSLESFTIPDSVTEVGYFTFYECPELKTVTFGSGLETTGYEMFEYCSSLTTVNFGKGLKSLDSLTFGYCTSLVSVTLPANIESIGNGCFGECRKLSEFVSEGLTGSIPFQAFLNDTSLSSVTLNEGVTRINRIAFYGCSSLKNITLPASIEFVHFLAFPSTTVITNKNKDLHTYEETGYRIVDNVSISGSYMYDMAFQVLTLVNQERNDAGLSSLVMDESLLDTAMLRGSEISVLFAHTRPDGSSWYTANSAEYAENIAMGYSTASSVMNSWMNSADHRSNILSADYTTIGIGCFYINGTYYWTQCFGIGSSSANCSQPANQNVTNILPLAVGEFEEPVHSTGIVGSIQYYSYTYSTNLPSTMIAGSDTAIQVYVRGSASGGIRVPINNTGITYSSGNTGILTVNSSGTVHAVSSGSTYITVSLTYSSTSQDILVFREDAVAGGTCGDNLIWNVTDKGELLIEGSGAMYDSVYSTSVPWYNYLNQITSVKISDEVTKIGHYAFYGLTNVQNIVLPSHLEYIGISAFGHCTGLTSITIPSGVWYVGIYAFQDCSNLKTIIFEGSAPILDYALFVGVTATAYYIPDSSWTSDILNSYYFGNIKWVAYNRNEGIPSGELNGFVASNGSWYYYENGVVNGSRNDVIQGTLNGENGWWYVVGGKVQLNYTGVANYANAYGWWYIKDGKVDFSKTGIEENQYGWWRVVNGQVDFSCNSVEQNDYGWWYLLGGQVQFGYTGVANYANAYGWWYISGGKVDFSKTSIEPNNYGWWRVVGGKVDFGCNSVEQNVYGWWYVVGGQVQFGYTGVANYANAYGWWYIRGGQVDFSRNSVDPNNFGWWRVIGGKVDFSFTGWATNSYGRWYCVNGKVDFSRS